MFTGIIERTGRVAAIRQEQTNVHFTIESDISDELKVDQSVSHNGVCLTVVDLIPGKHTVTAIQETLQKTALGTLREGDWVNLERCMPASGRFDGHIVQGHVDCTGVVLKIEDLHGSWQVDFGYDTSVQEVTVEKGSICVDGVSLTCFNSGWHSFSVALIPYTWEHTRFRHLAPGSVVNLEFDIVGKYIRRLLDSRGQLPH